MPPTPPPTFSLMPQSPSPTTTSPSPSMFCNHAHSLLGVNIGAFVPGCCHKSSCQDVTFPQTPTPPSPSCPIPHSPPPPAIPGGTDSAGGAVKRPGPGALHPRCCARPVSALGCGLGCWTALRGRATACTCGEEDLLDLCAHDRSQALRGPFHAGCHGAR